MYVKRVILQNLRGFEDLDFRFERPDERFEGWTVITGDNGSGKTALLKAIALAIVGPDIARALQPSLRGWIRRGAKRASIAVEIVPGEEDGVAKGPRKRLAFWSELELVQNGQAADQGGIFHCRLRALARRHFGSRTKIIGGSWRASRTKSSSAPRSRCATRARPRPWRRGMEATHQEGCPIVLRLAFRVRPGAREDLLAFLREAIPFYEAPGGIRARVLERADDPDAFIEEFEYATRADYEADDHRVQHDPEMKGYLDRWRALLAGRPEVTVYQDVTGRARG